MPLTTQATRANALHFLASKVRTNSSSTWHRSTSFTNKGEAVALAGSEHGAALAQPEPAATIDLKALSGLRQLLADRLFRFFPHNDEVIVGSIGGGDSGSANSMKNVDGANHHRHRPCECQDCCAGVLLLFLMNRRKSRGCIVWHCTIACTNVVHVCSTRFRYMLQYFKV